MGGACSRKIDAAKPGTSLVEETSARKEDDKRTVAERVAAPPGSPGRARASARSEEDARRDRFDVAALAEDAIIAIPGMAAAAPPRVA